MLLSSSMLPFSMFQLLVDDYLVVPEAFAYRPDNIVSERFGPNLSVEMLCNEASNSSPLSLSPGSTYLLPSRLFVNKFSEFV